MEELTLRFGSKEEAKKVFALFSAMQKEKSTGATSAAPPPPTIPKETTAQPSISHTEEPQVSIGALAHDQSHAETGPSTSTAERDAEESGGQEDGINLAEELERMAVDERRDEKANEEETLVSDGKDEGETLVDNSMEGETPVFEFAEGETPVLFAEGETPRNSEGETTFVSVEGGTPSLVDDGETPACRKAEGETLVMVGVGETPKESVGEEVPVNTEIQEPEEGGLKEVVNLVDDPEEEESPVDLREARRKA